MISGRCIARVALALSLAATSAAAQPNQQTIQGGPGGVAAGTITGGTFNLGVPSQQQASAPPPTLTAENVSRAANPGCNDTRGTQVEVQIPADRRFHHTEAVWINTGNLSRQGDISVVERDGRVVASGEVAGLNRDWTGNCQSGGQGQIRLRVWTLPK